MTVVATWWLATVVATAAQSEPPSRLVTLGAAVTEIVHALGAGEAIVGIDSTSTTVPLGREVDDVGFFRRVSAPGVLSLKPTRVIAAEDAGPPQVFRTLESAEVPVTRVSSAHSVEAAIQRIETIAKLLDREEQGSALVKSMRESLARVERPKRAPRVLFIYARGAGTLLVAGRNTSATSIIELAGGEPAVTAFEGFKPFSPEAVIAAAPDVLLLTDGGLASLGGTEGVTAHEVLGQTPAVKAGRIIAMDDLRLLGFGPELGEVARELARRFAAAAEG